MPVDVIGRVMPSGRIKELYGVKYLDFNTTTGIYDTSNYLATMLHIAGTSLVKKRESIAFTTPALITSEQFRHIDRTVFLLLSMCAVQKQIHCINFDFTIFVFT